MQKITEYIVNIVLLALSTISKHVSDSVRIKIGSLIGLCLRLLSKKRYNITYDNIKHAFPD